MLCCYEHSIHRSHRCILFPVLLAIRTTVAHENSIDLPCESGSEPLSGGGVVIIIVVVVR